MVRLTRYPSFPGQLGRYNTVNGVLHPSIKSLATRVKQGLPNPLRRVGRTLIFFALYPVRWLGVRTLARGKVSGQALIKQRGSLPATTKVTEVSLPSRADEKRGVRPLTSADTLPAKRPGTSSYVLVDITDREHSFRNNHLVTPDHRVIYEDKVSFQDLPLSIERLETTRHVPGTVAYLSSTGVDNYFHWMCQLLPLIAFYRNHLGRDPDFYYVGSTLRSWHYESLEYFGVAPERVLNEGLTADRLLAVVPNRHKNFDEEFFAFVRQRMVPDRPPQTPSRRLFIGRGQSAKSRRLLNERACARLLERYGFEYLTMDGMSIADEVELFASASAVVTTHGAVLTNLLYASPDIDVLDIMPYGARHPSFADFYDLCDFLGCGYGVVRGEKIPSQSWRRDTEVDVCADLDKLERAVVSLLDARSNSQPNDGANVSEHVPAREQKQLQQPLINS